MLVLTNRTPSTARPSPSAKTRDAGRLIEPAATGDELAEKIAAAVVAAQSSAEGTDETAALQQRMQFDTVLRQRAELDRELNALRDLSMEQVKRDDELLKKWIALI